MDTRISDFARREKAFITKDVLQYRHPWVLGPDGRGSIVRLGVKKLGDLQQSEILVECNTLLERSPKSRRDAPATVRQKLVESYFSKLEALNVGPDPTATTQDVLNAIETTHIQNFKKGVRVKMPDTEVIRRTIEELRTENETLKREVERLKAAAAKSQQALGERTVAEKTSSLEECLDFWKMHFKATSANQTHHTKRRATSVMELVGFKKPIGSITKADLEKAIDATGAVDFERTKIIQAVKRFFKDLTKPTEENGKGFTVNPAANITAEAVNTIQSRKIRQEDSVPIIDPRELLKLPLTDYMKACIAVIGFGGLRVSEAAGLRWKDVSFADGTLKVRANPMKTDTKTEISYRLAKPFENVWTYLKKLKAEKRSEEFVFPKYDDAKKMWFHQQKLVVKCTLPKVIKDEVDAAGGTGKAYALSMRRWWSTTMQEKGFADLESITGGHDKGTARNFYANRESIVKAAKIGRV